MSSRDDLIKQLQERRRFGKRPQREDNAAAQAMAEAKLQGQRLKRLAAAKSPVSRNKATSHPPGRGGRLLQRRHWRLCVADDAAPWPPASEDPEMALPANQALLEMAARATGGAGAQSRRLEDGQTHPAQESHFLCCLDGGFSQGKRFSRLVMEDPRNLGATGATLGRAVSGAAEQA